MGEYGNSHVPGESKREELDKGWYERFERDGSFEGYSYFEIKKDKHPEQFSYFEEQKRQFLAGEIENPGLVYPLLETETLEKWEENLLLLKNDVIRLETNDIVKQAYRWKINEKLVETRMLQMSEKGDMRLFKRYNEFVNGKPDKDIFLHVVDLLKKKIEKAKLHEDKEIQNLALDLESMFENVPSSGVNIESPSAGTMEVAREATLKEVGNLIDIPLGDTDKKIDSEEIVNLFSEALKTLGAHGWNVKRVEGTRAAINVSQEKKQVEIPASRVLTKKELQGLVAHEIGTHVARRENGERTHLKLLGLGLDRYVKGEEGVATLREQSVKGKIDDFAGFPPYLAIGLAYGLDGIKRDFRGVYSVMEKYHTLDEVLSKNKSIAEVQVDAQKKAWDRCMRTFRGTDGKTKGVCYTKDMVYREGNIAVWDVVKSNPAEMERFSVGKYDPSNERHLWVLSQLGIGEEDLEKLDE